jgi:hypothetical protein
MSVRDDGGAGLRKIAADKFSFALLILDMCQGREHLSDLAGAWYGKDSPGASAAKVRWTTVSNGTGTNAITPINSASNSSPRGDYLVPHPRALNPPHSA